MAQVNTNKHIVKATAKSTNNIVFIKSGSSVSPTGPLGNSALQTNRNTQVSLQETHEWRKLNALSQVPTNLLVGGTNFLEFNMEDVGIVDSLYLKITVKNNDTDSDGTHVWEAPAMFMMKFVEVYQNGAKVGSTILPMQQFLHRALCDTPRELLHNVNETALTADTLIASTTAGNIAYNGATKTFYFEFGKFIPIIQSNIPFKLLKQCKIKITFENITVLCPTNTNGTNEHITVTDCQLVCKEKLVSSDCIRKIANAMSSDSGYVSRVITYKEDQNSAYVATANSVVPYQSRVWNNDAIVCAFLMLRSSTQTGAGLVNTHYAVNTAYLKDTNGNFIDSQLETTGSELIVQYKDAFRQNDYILQSNKYPYPIMIGSSDVVKSLQTGQNHGYKVLNECVVNVNATETATRNLLFCAFVYSQLVAKNGIVTVV